MYVLYLTSPLVRESSSVSLWHLRLANTQFSPTHTHSGPWVWTESFHPHRYRLLSSSLCPLLSMVRAWIQSHRFKSEEAQREKWLEVRLFSSNSPSPGKVSLHKRSPSTAMLGSMIIAQNVIERFQKLNWKHFLSGFIASICIFKKKKSLWKFCDKKVNYGTVRTGKQMDSETDKQGKWLERIILEHTEKGNEIWKIALAYHFLYMSH